MIHPLPPGTRDVLPDEARELRDLGERIRGTFARAGYGEVRTPLLEYEHVLLRGDDRAAGASYRLFDEHGQVLALRSDMTVPIARLVAARYADEPGPLRLSYLMHAYRATRVGVGQPREFLQAGLELLGLEGPAGDAEVVGLTIEALTAAGLGRHRVGLGDGSLFPTLLASLEVPDAARPGLLEALVRRDLVGLVARVERLEGIGPASRRMLATVPTLRGGPEVLARVDGGVRSAVEDLSHLHELLQERGAAERVIFDLGLVRDMSYYTGMVFEVYDPAVGFALGGGGRYDHLLARFGPARVACGVGLDLQRVHVAQAAEERLA